VTKKQQSKISFPAPTGPDRALRLALTKTKGLKMQSSYFGHLVVGLLKAGLKLEPGGWITLSLPVMNPLEPVEAMGLNRHLAGNLRYAAFPSGDRWLAETCVDSASHLPRTLGELARELEEITQGLKETDPDPDLPRTRCRSGYIMPEKVEALLQGRESEIRSVVRHDRFWELRLRLRGEVIPVRVVIEGAELHLFRHVLRRTPPAERMKTLAVQALFMNTGLRGARLSLDGEALIAEARLHDGLLQPCWLKTAALAVAVAHQHCCTVLRILAEEEEIAHWFDSIFFAEEPRLQKGG
jgi:hypothetical protein